MPWFKIDDGFPTSKPVLRIPRRYRANAIGLWTLAGAWSAKELTDGHIAEHLLEEFASSPAMAAHLVACGLWETAEDGWNFRHWAKYQPTREQVMADREREAERKRAYRASKRSPNGTPAGRTVGHHPESEQPDPTRPDPTNRELSSEIADAIPDPERPEVLALCERLAKAIEANGLPKPLYGKTWITAARLLIDKDGFTVQQVEWMIDWATNDEFWRSNILSMPKLREKFPQLKLRAVPETAARPKVDPNWALR